MACLDVAILEKVILQDGPDMTEQTLAAGHGIAYIKDMEDQIHSQGERQRARQLGIKLGRLTPGPWNAITDIPGVKVG